MASISKKALLESLRKRVMADLEAAVVAQRDAQEGATHEEARPENDKDTRATEASYMARGLAQRVADLHQAASLLANLVVVKFGDDDRIAISALVTVENDAGDELVYFVAPAGGGVKVAQGGTTVAVITPSSPLGQALIGRRMGEDLALRGKTLTIVGVS
jgi:transcription elongation GreA/GreB family factor